jgi:hypothetical protein
MLSQISIEGSQTVMLARKVRASLFAKKTGPARWGQKNTTNKMGTETMTEELAGQIALDGY